MSQTPHPNLIKDSALKPVTALIMFMHTSKAVRGADAPADRVYLVSETYKEGRSTRYFAWKCRIIGTKLKKLHVHDNNCFTAKQLTEERLFDLAVFDETRDIERPTADSRADSFYKRVTFEDVRALLY